MGTDKIIHSELSASIIGAGMTVLNTLPLGLDKKAYENSLVIEPRKREFTAEQQRRLSVGNGWCVDRV
jgi:hypothetical protein